MGQRIGDVPDMAADVQEHLEFYGVEPSDIGILLGPEFEDEKLIVFYHIRVIEDRYDFDVRMDGKYIPDNHAAIEVYDEDYPEIIEQFEDTFPDAELQYYEPIYMRDG